MARFGGPARGVGHKSSETDPVSDADREAEATIARMLRSERPDDGLLSEEGTVASPGGARRWIVDPLDGTTNFLYGQPAWSVSVALEDGDGALVAVVHDPTRGESFRAARGRGSELNGARVRVRSAERLATALVATGFSYEAARRAAQAETLGRVLPRVRDVRRAGSAALDLAWVAAGRLDGYYEMGLHPWDWAAGALLVAEAGGAVERFGDDPAGLLAASPQLLPGLRELVGG